MTTPLPRPASMRSPACGVWLFVPGLDWLLMLHHPASYCIIDLLGVRRPGLGRVAGGAGACCCMRACIL